MEITNKSIQKCLVLFFVISLLFSTQVQAGDMPVVVQQEQNPIVVQQDYKVVESTSRVAIEPQIVAKEQDDQLSIQDDMVFKKDDNNAGLVDINKFPGLFNSSNADWADHNLYQVYQGSIRSQAVVVTEDGSRVIIVLTDPQDGHIYYANTTLEEIMAETVQFTKVYSAQNYNDVVGIVLDGTQFHVFWQRLGYYYYYSTDITNNSVWASPVSFGYIANGGNFYKADPPWVTNNGPHLLVTDCYNQNSKHIYKTLNGWVVESGGIGGPTGDASSSYVTHRDSVLTDNYFHIFYRGDAQPLRAKKSTKSSLNWQSTVDLSQSPASLPGADSNANDPSTPYYGYTPAAAAGDNNGIYLVYKPELRKLNYAELNNAYYADPQYVKNLVTWPDNNLNDYGGPYDIVSDGNNKQDVAVVYGYKLWDINNAVGIYHIKYKHLTNAGSQDLERDWTGEELISFNYSDQWKDGYIGGEPGNIQLFAYQKGPSSNANHIFKFTTTQGMYFMLKDAVPPAIVNSALAADNSYIDITFSEGIYGSINGTGAVAKDDFKRIFFKLEGTASDVDLDSISKTNGNALAGGEKTVRIHLDVNGDSPNGKEKFDIQVKANRVYDLFGNVAPDTEHIGDTNLNDEVGPVFSGLVPASDSSVKSSNVGYTLSEDCTSGSVTWTRTDGVADANSPHTYTLTGNDLLEGAHQDINTSITLIEGTIYTVSFEGTDLLANPGDPAESTIVTYDVTTQAPALTKPDSADNATIEVDFDLPEAGEAGTVRLIFTESGFPNNLFVVTFANGSETAGNHPYELNGDDLSASNGVASVVPAQNDTLVDGSTYNVKLEYQDAAGNPAASVTHTGFKYDTTAPTIDSFVLATDNSFLDITFSEEVWNTYGNALNKFDFDRQYEDYGSPASLSWDDLTKEDGQTLVGGEITVRMNLTVTGATSGGEEIKMTVLTDKIYDEAGNVMANTETTDWINLNDETPPEIIATPSPSAIFGNWYDQNVTVNLTAAGAVKIYYKLDGAGSYTMVNGNATSVLISGDGPHTLYYYAEDGNGNSGVNSPGSIIVNIDTLAPVISTVTVEDVALVDGGSIEVLKDDIYIKAIIDELNLDTATATVTYIYDNSVKGTLDKNDLNDQSTDIYNLPSGSYFLEVNALDLLNHASATFTGTIKINDLATPSLSIEKSGQSTITLNLNGNLGAGECYRIYRSSDNTNWSLLVDDHVNPTHVISIPPVAGSQYYYQARIASADKTVESTPSNSVVTYHYFLDWDINNGNTNTLNYPNITNNNVNELDEISDDVKASFTPAHMDVLTVTHVSSVTTHQSIYIDGNGWSVLDSGSVPVNPNDALSIAVPRDIDWYLVGEVN